MSGPKFHETDEWFDVQRTYLDNLELHLKQLVKAVSAVSQQRREVAASTAELSHMLLILSGSSLSRSLSTCFAGLGEVERRTCELTDQQAEADVRELGSVLYEYERIVGSIRVSRVSSVRLCARTQPAHASFLALTESLRDAHRRMASVAQGRRRGAQAAPEARQVGARGARQLGSPAHEPAGRGRGRGKGPLAQARL